MRHFFLLISCFLLPHTLVFGQVSTGKIRGTTHSADGKPVIAATILLKDTRYGASSEADGSYSLEAPEGRYTLVVQLLGLETQTLPIRVRAGETVTIPPLTLRETSRQLDDVVVTGQYEPQSMRQSVYQIRTIDRERIQLRGATNLIGVLNNELGIRFSNDLVLGTSDIQLMGMSGRNVKILLDGVPMVDRGDTRESLNQIDINTIERVEIVEGPMSVSYGTDALAGIINVITKKPGNERLLVTARIQEETAHTEYRPLTGKGVHNQNLGVTWQRKGWNAYVGGTHNGFGGWQGLSTTRAKDWHPKEQWLGNVKLGYRTDHFNIWYRLDALDETINAMDPVNINTNQARDQKYLTNRFTHQLQSDWKASEHLHINAILSYTDYSRKTQTTNIDLNTGRRTLSLGAGEQDLSLFDTRVFRATAQYKLSNTVSFQPGVDINLDAASGARILGSPSIHDYAFFVSSELKPTSVLTIRPGLRFIKNSVYDAPPVIPSLNAKLTLHKNADFRFAYARGFRSPALRELYFNFFDASHSIKGNPNLKAEYSNSFNGSLTWRFITSPALRLTSTVTGFYNDFHNLIDYGNDPANPGAMMMVNINRFKTTGGTLNHTLNARNIQVTLGFSHIGRYNSLTKNDTDLPEFVWSPEVNSNITYHLQKLDTKVSFFYKYTGKRPVYESVAGSDGTTTVHLAETAAYHWADFTINKSIVKSVTLNTGVKNLFNVTRLTNTSGDVERAHSTGGAVPLSYGRSYFLGLSFQWSN
ncbi:outer membrane receptor for ferrienterochelin and colicins [Larkinella arboricola]|uniref:Outer membrane receptor for ferrienterochelin and colicins n=1 Tax=Larkinella arboricola TaxID=643671 RepID=A0A327X994_LARAB|nr:TonB-dependent receptor [Larkinella arboricola]RAK03261.1 outer membrane receptor for ferrienterochelin and colicins [Larkinella arboricola]